MKRKPSITFVTIGDVSVIATMKRALGMANPLASIGWAVSIVVLDCKENRLRVQMECRDDVSIHYYQEGDIGYEVAQKTRLVSEIQSQYVFFCSFSVRNRIRKRQLGYKPVIIIEHSELSSSIKTTSFTKRMKAKIMEYGSVLYGDALVCASRYLEKEYGKYKRYLFRRNMSILYSPYAFNSEVINAPKVIEEQLRIKYSGKKIFLYMGTMTKNYGLFSMIEAVSQLRENHENLLLLLMGKGPHWDEARSEVENKNLQKYVHFLGYVPENEISSYFEVADAFISPLNNTIQDIARCPSKIYMYLPFGKPVITCKIGEPSEIFGEDGYYFDNNDSSTLANVISRICLNDKSASVVNINEHSWDKRSTDFDEWIRENNAVRY